MRSETARRIHFGMMAFWAANMMLVWFIPVGQRIAYLVVVSIYANFVGHWSGWSAERPTQVEE